LSFTSEQPDPKLAEASSFRIGSKSKTLARFVLLVVVSLVVLTTHYLFIEKLVANWDLAAVLVFGTWVLVFSRRTKDSRPEKFFHL